MQKQLFRNGIHKLPERWAKCVEFNGQYFEYIIFLLYLKLFLLRKNC